MADAFFRSAHLVRDEAGGARRRGVGKPVAPPLLLAARVTGRRRKGTTDAIASLVGENLRRYRTHRGLSLVALASASGVSRSMLSQIEVGQSSPTITTLCRISAALKLPLAALLSQAGESDKRDVSLARSQSFRLQRSPFTWRPLCPLDVTRRIGFYELRVAPSSLERADAHAPGTMEHLVVAEGALELTLGTECHCLVRGDAVTFAADAPHMYRNGGVEPAVMYLVLTYSDPLDE